MSKKVAYYGIFITLALVASYVERLIPFNFGIPGIKLGLANLIILVVLYTMTWKDACYISFIRIILVGLLFGNLFAIIYSLSGGILSLFIMIMLKKTKQFSILGISVAGGVSHNIGQIIMAALVLENKNMLYYLPILLIFGVIAGVLIGIAAAEVIKRIPANIIP